MYLSRFLSSSSHRSEFHEESLDSQETDDLRSRIFRLRQPKRSATNVLHRWVSEGNQITISELRQISKELRKSQRYKHALEVRSLSPPPFLSLTVSLAYLVAEKMVKKLVGECWIFFGLAELRINKLNLYPKENKKYV